MVEAQVVGLMKMLVGFMNMCTAMPITVHNGPITSDDPGCW
jgi:hypothetical protein